MSTSATNTNSEGNAATEGMRKLIRGVGIAELIQRKEEMGSGLDLIHLRIRPAKE